MRRAKKVERVCFSWFLRSLTRGSLKVGRCKEACTGCRLRRSPGLAKRNSGGRGRLKPAATLADLKFGHYRVHSLPSRGGNWPQWLASTTFALQSRGGDGVTPSSRARSPRLMGRGKARCE